MKDLNLDSSKEMHPVHKFSTDSEILKVEFLINLVTKVGATRLRETFTFTSL